MMLRLPHSPSASLERSRAGMSLLNVILLLMLVGVLVMAGAALVGPLVKRGKITDTKTILTSNADAVMHAVAVNGRLPNNTTFPAVAVNRFDAWGKDIFYLYDASLTLTSADSFCRATATNLTVNSTTNVAFALFSLGDDYSIESTWDGLPALSDATAYYPASTAVTATLANSDIYRIVTLAELQSRANCSGFSGGRLRIINNELPKACSGAAYSATIYAEGGVPFNTNQYQWSIANLPAGVTATPNAVYPAWSSATPTLQLGGTAALGTPTIYLRDNQSPQTIVQRNLSITTSTACGPSGGQISFRDDMASFITAENTGAAVAVTGTTLVLGGGAVNTTGCYWYPLPQTLSHHVMRGYYEFRFNPADTSADSRAQADGFTFTLIEDPGGSLTSFCGTTGAGSNLGYRGLPGDSLAVEFDTYPSGATYADPAANHIAMARDGSNYHTAPNPACTTSNLGCYYTATNNTWFEEGSTHRVRIELDRQYSNAACSTTAINGTYALLKVWMDPTLVGYLDLTQNYSGTAPVLQQCVSLPDANDLTNVDNVIFGFTEATGSATQNLTVTNFAIGFYCSSYRVWNTTGARYDFYVAGSCRNNRNNNAEITDATTIRLSAQGTSSISRDGQSGTCSPGSPLGSITFFQAAAADNNGDCMVNYGPGDTVIDR